MEWKYQRCRHVNRHVSTHARGHLHGHVYRQSEWTFVVYKPPRCFEAYGPACPPALLARPSIRASLCLSVSRPVSVCLSVDSNAWTCA